MSYQHIYDTEGDGFYNVISYGNALQKWTAINDYWPDTFTNVCGRPIIMDEG